MAATAVERAGETAAEIRDTAGARGAASARIAHGLNALLHTLHSLEQQEPGLCAVLHAIERSGRLTSATERELAHALECIPVEMLREEIELLWHALDEAPALAARR